MGHKTSPLQCLQCYTLNPSDSRFCSKCGSSLREQAETLSLDESPEISPDKRTHFQPGDVFDRRYRIIEEIGRGGMGRVYKAADTELNITVALKVIHPQYSASPEFIERFKKETLTARSISHENVIRIHDLGEAGNIKYISMEYIKGQNLNDLIKTSGCLAVETALHIIRQICEALKSAHGKGIVHQDLKPSNIMIDSGGRVYIMDFGLARSAYGADALRSRSAVGTPMYMSPEQVKGEKVDQRADLYALGGMVFEMLTGQPVFTAATRGELMRKQVEETPRNPSKLNSRIPLFLENIVLRCLEKDPAKRFQTVEEIIAVLEKHAVKTRVFALKRVLFRYWYAFLLVLVLAAAAIFYSRAKEPASPVGEARRKSLAIVYLTNNTGDKSLDYLGKAVTELLIADLLQSQYIRVITADKIYLVLQKLNLLEAAAFSSEDLKKIAFDCGADYVLSGNFTRAGETLLVSTSLQDAGTIQAIGIERVEGKGEKSIFSIVDGLSKEIKADFNLRPEEIAKDIDKDVIQITTDSTQALQAYIEGKVLYNLGELQESLSALEKAVNLDPEFAVAFRKLAEVSFYLGKNDDGNKYLNKAVSLLNKVSERDYYLIQGTAAATHQLTIENYKKLLELYPDDLEANGLLGSLYRNTEEWGLAQAQFEKIIEIDQTQDLAYDNLAHIYMADGLYAKARNILESRRDIFSDTVQFHLRMGMAYMCEGLYDPALAEAAQALAADKENVLVLEMTGHLYQLSGRFDEAEKIYRQMIAGADLLTQYLGQHWICYLLLARGQFEQMDKEIGRGLEFSSSAGFNPGIYNFNLMRACLYLQENRLEEALEAANRMVEAALESQSRDYIEFSHHLRGLIYARQGKIDEAKTSAEKLRRSIEESEILKRLRHYHHLTGEIELQQGLLDQAIDDFRAAIDLLPAEHFKSDIHVLYLDSLASAFSQLRAWDKARAEYERITSLTTGRLRWADKYARSFYHLAEICLTQGKKKEAAKQLEIFLGLWDRADPERAPEVAKAKQLLTELTGGRDKS